MRDQPGWLHRYRQQFVVLAASSVLLSGVLTSPWVTFAQSPSDTPASGFEQRDLRTMLTLQGNAAPDDGLAATRSVNSAELPATPAPNVRPQTTLRDRVKTNQKTRESKRAERQDRRHTLGSRAYDITRSGRLRSSTSAALAFDGNPETVWSSAEASPAAYAWFDLGASLDVGAVRWLMPVAAGPLTIQISNDRQNWTTVHVDPAPASPQWRTINVDQTGRYVRFMVSTRTGGVELAEVQVLRPRVAAITGSGQQVTAPEPPLVTVTDANGQLQDADADIQTPPNDSREPEITINGKKTRCSGSGKCQVEGTAPEVTNDCGDGTTNCTITVGASGGTAVCDASGGNRQRPGKNKGRAGTCTAEADSGTVEIGDIDR